MGADWRNIKGQVPAPGGIIRQQGRKPFIDPTVSDTKSTEASTSMSIDDLSAVDSAAVSSTSRTAEVRPVSLATVVPIY